MSILVDERTRILVQGITGSVGRVDTRLCLDYGSRIVAGVTPGRGGESVSGVPVFDTVAEAVERTGATAAVQYVPARHAADAVVEAAASGLSPIVAIAENLPRQDAWRAAVAARNAGSVLIGFNTNGIISPGRTKLGGIGGPRPDDLFRPGTVGVCSRSGGMSAEIARSLARAGSGVSTCVSMGGESITGRTMAEYARWFEADEATRSIVVFGEPGSEHEAEMAAAMERGEVTKPVVAMIVGQFQDAYPAGSSFGHLSAMVRLDTDRAVVKRDMLAAAGALIAERVEDIPDLLGGC
ncbi:MAG: succinate--CoA ligase subunit alpha [bacterium]|nr:succinate--CoA ligase subunit alpha [bacterium]